MCFSCSNRNYSRDGTSLNKRNYMKLNAVVEIEDMFSIECVFDIEKSTMLNDKIKKARNDQIESFRTKK